MTGRWTRTVPQALWVAPLLGALALSPRTSRAQDAADAGAVSTDAAEAASRPTVEVEVRPGLAPARERAMVPRTSLDRCFAQGARRNPSLGGAVQFQLRHAGRWVVVLVDSTLGDHQVERCLRRVLEGASARPSVTDPPRSIVLTWPTDAPLCNPDGSDVTSGHRTAGCTLSDTATDTVRALRGALQRAPLGAEGGLEQSCGFTAVTVWLDRGGRLFAYGATSVNSDGESPELSEFTRERSAALRALAPHAHGRLDDVGAPARVVLRLGGCD